VAANGRVGKVMIAGELDTPHAVRMTAIDSQVPVLKARGKVEDAFSLCVAPLYQQGAAEVLRPFRDQRQLLTLLLFIRLAGDYFEMQIGDAGLDLHEGRAHLGGRIAARLELPLRFHRNLARVFIVDQRVLGQVNLEPEGVRLQADVAYQVAASG